ncbi:Adaptor protein complex AP-3 delta subunit, partial [Artomyces pyxidatus]
MWERTLQDLIRGLRANKKDEAKFIAQAVEEIRNEIKGKDMELKAGAVLKLTYLEMMGYDMTWASFHVVEVMSSPKYHLKTVGYLAATQSFSQDTDVLMLTTNLLKKDLSSNPNDVAVSLNGFSHIVSPDLARDLSHDLVAMLNHSRPNIRKRAVIALYKALVKYPEATPFALTRLKEKLDDQDTGVVSATINVLCELVRRDPKDYLPLAPQLFRLLTTSSNNWMLIKLVKLFGFLSPYEPRLVKKLQPPITELISTSSAISLLYECVHTCIVGGMLQHASGNSLAEMCVTKLAAFLQDTDQNLKYIALLALVKIVPTHSHLVARYQDVIVTSVNDQDISIRMRALDLLSAMVTRENLQSIVQQLLSHLVRPDPSSLPSAAQSLAQNASATSPSTAVTSLAPAQLSAYRLILSRRIISICSQDTYSNIVDFQWYLSVLVDLAYVAGVDVGAEIRDQLVDVVGRVRAVRRWAVELMVRLLSDETFLANAKEEGSCAEVLWAAAWICGENCREIAEPQKLLPFLLQDNISILSPETIGIYLQAAMKLFGTWASQLSQEWEEDDLPRVKDVVDTIRTRMSDFASSPEIEVQERAANALQLFSFIHADLASFHPRPDSIVELPDSFESTNSQPAYPKSLLLISPLFSTYDLNPVNPAAQANVPIPDGLDLESWIVQPPKDAAPEPSSATLGDDERPLKKVKGKGKAKAKSKGTVQKNGTGPQVVLTPSETPAETAEERIQREKQRLARLERQRDDPYYIPVEPSAHTSADDIDSIPVVHLDDMPPMPQAVTETRFPSLLRDAAAHTSPEPFVIDKDGEMPDGTPPAPAPSQKLSRSASPHTNGKSPPASTALPGPPPSFPEYIVEDEVPRTGTPEPIKVTRAKKKGAGTTKKKRIRT